MKKRISMFWLMVLFLLTACGKKGDDTIVPMEKPVSEEISAVAETPVPTLEEEPEEQNNNYFIDIHKKHQTIDGFGAAFTWYADWIFYTSESDRKELLDALFSDAKLSVIRLKNEYEYVTDDTDKNISTMKQIFDAATERAAEYGEEPIVLLSCWSPPARLKSNGSINGGGSLAKGTDGSFLYEEYARWWVDAVQYYKENGIRIDYVSIQNECDFMAGYDGCEFAKSETETHASYAKAFLAVYHAFQAAFGEDAPKMIAPETMSCKPVELKAYINEIMENEPQSIYGVGYHLYTGGISSDEGKTSTVNPDSFNTNFSSLNTYFEEYALWQTEFYRGKGIQMAELIHNAMTQGNMNAYLYWGAVWESNADPFEANKMIGITKNANNKFTWDYCADYYAFRHFSEFIRPGYTRVASIIKGNQNIDNSAYLSDDGKTLVLVLINPDEEEKEQVIPEENFAIRNSEIYQSVLSIENPSKNKLYENIGDLGEEKLVTLPGESITTIVLSLE